MKTFRLNFLYRCLIPLVVLTFIGCGIKPPSKYFKNEKKVGIIYIIYPIGYRLENNYQDYDRTFFLAENMMPLYFVESKIRPEIELQIKDNYKNIFKEKGKSFIEIDHEQYLQRSDSLQEFKKPFLNNKSYYQFDLRPLKSEYFKDYDIDELLFVRVWYGVYYLELFHLLERRRWGCTINSEIVDLNDNSIIYKSLTNIYLKIEGKWNTPPEYENLSNTIKSAISKSLEKQREKLIN